MARAVELHLKTGRTPFDVNSVYLKSVVVKMLGRKDAAAIVRQQHERRAVGDTVDSGTPCAASQSRKGFSERLRLTIVASANLSLV
jgi:hypothetical protein